MLVSEVVVRKAVEIQFRAPVRLVVDALAAFFFHGIALVVEIGLGDVKRAHAVGFQVQAEVELVLGQLFEVDRAVFTGGAVHVAAIVEHEDEMLAFADICRALEHHVLEQVSEAGAARKFVATAHVVGDVDSVDRGAMVWD